MPRAAPVLREKVIDEEGNAFELVIWKVPITGQRPSGIRCRLAFIRKGERRPAVLYDNHHPKGHQRHIEGAQEPYASSDVERLLEDSRADVKRITGGKQWQRP